MYNQAFILTNLGFRPEICDKQLKLSKTKMFKYLRAVMRLVSTFSYELLLFIFLVWANNNPKIIINKENMVWQI